MDKPTRKPFDWPREPLTKEEKQEFRKARPVESYDAWTRQQLGEGPAAIKDAYYSIC